MEPNILSHIASRTGISSRQIAATADLLDSGATIPFISRYRKEATGCLDETQIQAIATAYEEAVETEKRRAFIIDAINSQGKLTDELKAKIESATDTTTLEDLYLPYKQKRRTRAEIAREKGLEPLAKIIMAQRNDRIRQAAERFVGKDVADSDTAIAGALDIIAEWVAENNAVRQSVRNTFAREAVITAKVVKGKEEEASNFQNYFDFSSPLKRCGSHRVLAIDPGYRTGCKVVCLDSQGNLLHNDVIYPTPPRNETAMAAKKIANLIETYRIDAIALGNGTASRETERFLGSLRYNRDVRVFVVSEDGASIYSASKVARDEFPDKDVTVRGAVSIGRRLIDPLAELVKIEPRSIGVGQYQHDVNQTKLKKALEFTVESCVNSVGVNLNTASKELLTYVSGVGTQLAQNIVDYRAANGDFRTRRQLLNVPKLGPKAFEQCAGFLRIPDGDNPLDNTAVHPENYPLVEQMAADCHCSVDDLIRNKAAQATINLQQYATAAHGMPTLLDIMAELDKPGRDPRKAISVMKFDDTVNSFDDLREGLVLNGIVTNITQFGVFVDIGIKENGLVHISELSDHYVSTPSDVVALHQQLRVRIKAIDTERRRIALTLKNVDQQ